MPNYGAISQQGKLETRNKTVMFGDTWRIIADLVRWIMVPCSGNRSSPKRRGWETPTTMLGARC